MCDGNLRSTIKALIMANEYLEAELEELQAAIAAGCIRTSRSRRGASSGLTYHHWSNAMADVTYYVAMPFLQRCRRIACRGRRGGMPELDGRAAPRRDAVARGAGNIGAVAFSRSGDPMTGEFGDAKLLRKFGNVPDDLGGL